MNYTTAPNGQNHASGLDRSSCSWRDALGPGFATGTKPSVLKAVSTAARDGYCG
jgi:hypothetical protein